MDTVWSHFHGMSKIFKFIETKSKMVVTRASGGGKEEILLNGDNISVLQKWKILESDYTPMWIYFTQLSRLWWNLQLMGRKHGGTGELGVWDGLVHIIIFKLDNQQASTVEHRELCSVLRGSLDRRGLWERMNTRMCMAESPCRSAILQYEVKS